jgi:hypothetical protein
MTEQRSSSPNTVVLAVIGLIGTIVAAYLTYRASTDPMKLSLRVTQTAEANFLIKVQLPASTVIPKPGLAPTEATIPTLTPSLTPTLPFLVDTSMLVGWIPDFTHSNGDSGINRINTIGNATELNYDVGKDGYVIITKRIDSQRLSDTRAIRFRYNGQGAANSIEFKLLLKYPGDAEDTTYGVLLPRATYTNNQWREVEVPYTEMTCWWPAPNCALHGNLLDPTVVDRLDFVVANKPGDDPGSGWVLFKDVLGLTP